MRSSFILIKYLVDEEEEEKNTTRKNGKFKFYSVFLFSSVTPAKISLPRSYLVSQDVCI